MFGLGRSLVILRVLSMICSIKILIVDHLRIKETYNMIFFHTLMIVLENFFDKHNIIIFNAFIKLKEENPL